MMLASVEDLGDRLGQSFTAGSPEYKRANSNLFDASALVTRETRPWMPGDAIPDVVKTVVLQAAERKFRNPGGLANRGMGPFTEGYGPQSSTGIYLTDDELRILSEYQDTNDGIISVPVHRMHERYRRSDSWAVTAGFPDVDPIPYFPEGWTPEDYLEAEC